MAKTARRDITLLQRRDGHNCHYCGVRCVRTKNGHGSPSDEHPTKDHVIPRSFGGVNHIDNYVLACAGCNNRRGTMLFFCKCVGCRDKIDRALKDTAALRNIFDGMIAHNRPRIRVTENVKRFRVLIGHGMKDFAKFEDAIHFANTGSLVKDKIYS